MHLKIKKFFLFLKLVLIKSVISNNVRILYNRKHCTEDVPSKFKKKNGSKIQMSWYAECFLDSDES